MDRETTIGYKLKLASAEVHKIEDYSLTIHDLNSCLVAILNGYHITTAVPLC